MRMLASILILIAYLGLFAFVLWFIAIRPRLPLKDKIGGLFQLLAAYTFIMGLLSASGVFAVFSGLQQNLTSSDPLLFLAGNFYMFTGLFSAMEIALDPNTMTLIALPFLLVQMLLLMMYAIIHFFVIVPLAYFAYLITSIPVDAILNASIDVKIAVGEEKVRIKALVEQNEAAIRHFAVGVPAFAISLLLKIWPLLRRERPNKSLD